MHALLAIAGAAIFLIAAVTMAFKPSDATHRSWGMPALFAIAFLVFSLVTVAREGPFGFWEDHVAGFWGNQIWFDLLLAIGTAWYLLVPRMRRLGMQPLPWLVLIGCTGSIGLLATVARYAYLETRSAN
ncbi:hypothetical protein [Algiphilus sp.]|uniref:hypothetical protein n=1 Tax=Algiphilus sp. TaxID=1872431 RepID=UPI003B51BDC3